MPKNNYLLAIDAGTGSARAILFDSKGNQLSVGQEEWTHINVDGVENSMDFDYENNWELIVRCIKEATKEIDTNDILALSATSMREGIVLYDAQGKELWAVANVDARAGEEVKELHKNLPEIEKTFYKESGQTFALGALPRLLWVKKHLPSVYENTAKISMISDWILAKLSGVIASEPSNAGTAGIYSLKNRSWSPQMAKEIGIKDNIFPPSFETGTPIGTITQEASTQTGLSTKTKVVMGGGDVQLGSAGLGVVDVGDVCVLGGSFWQQVLNIPNPTTPEDMRIRVNPHVVEGISQAEGITFFSGLVMRWFRDSFCDMEKQEAQKRGVDTYTVLEEMAEKVPVGSYGILPIFSDSMKYGKWYHASPSFLNLGLDSTLYNRASMFRSLQENACIVTQENLENIYAFTGVEAREIIFASGASKGFLWPQILADVTGKKVKIPRVKEATALGCAMAAGVGAGIYASLASISKELVVWEKTYEPNMQNHEAYKEIRKRWRKAYDVQLTLVDENITESMWKAPGV